MKILMEWAIIILMFFGGAILYDANESDNTVEKSNGKIGAVMLISGIILLFVWFSMYSNNQ